MSLMPVKVRFASPVPVLKIGAPTNWRLAVPLVIVPPANAESVEAARIAATSERIGVFRLEVWLRLAV
jgi:hypothetical protein